ncbi:MAG TPA: hypothetical protein VJS47_09635 [Rhizomicrobium sp.]|nr:hypothetical protein [Rhizomicrobium sp.]
MQTRNYVLAGAALLFLINPALAGQSTPAEREATRQLNLEATRQAQMNKPAQQTAETSVAAAPQAAPTTPVETAQGPLPASVPAQDVAMENPDGGAPAILSSIQRPPNKIANANVLDANGQTIGAVQRVEVTPEGTPTKVTIALIGKDEKMVVLDAGAVRYDSIRNEILAQQPADQIRSMAG